jgi:hypothetical protein
VFSLLCRDLIAAYLCCVGWFEVCGIMVSVKVGFLYMANSESEGVFRMVMSK